MLNCNQTNYCLMIGDSLLFPWADPDSLDTEISLYQKPTVSPHIGLSYYTLRNEKGLRSYLRSVMDNCSRQTADEFYDLRVINSQVISCIIG